MKWSTLSPFMLESCGIHGIHRYERDPSMACITVSKKHEALLVSCLNSSLQQVQISSLVSSTYQTCCLANTFQVTAQSSTATSNSLQPVSSPTAATTAAGSADPCLRRSAAFPPLRVSLLSAATYTHPYHQKSVLTAAAAAAGPAATAAARKHTDRALGPADLTRGGEQLDTAQTLMDTPSSAAAAAAAERVADRARSAQHDRKEGDVQVALLQSPDVPLRQQQQQHEAMQGEDGVQEWPSNVTRGSAGGGLESLRASSRRVADAFAAEEPSATPAAAAVRSATTGSLTAAASELAVLQPATTSLSPSASPLPLGIGGADEEFRAMIAALQQATGGPAAAAAAPGGPNGATTMPVGEAPVGQVTIAAAGSGAAANDVPTAGGGACWLGGSPVVAAAGVSDAVGGGSGTTAAGKKRKQGSRSSSRREGGGGRAGAAAAGSGGGSGGGSRGEAERAAVNIREGGQEGGGASRQSAGTKPAKHKRQKVETPPAAPAAADVTAVLFPLAATDKDDGGSSSLEQAAAAALQAARKSRAKSVRKSKTGITAAAVNTADPSHPGVNDDDGEPVGGLDGVGDLEGVQGVIADEGSGKKKGRQRAPRKRGKPAAAAAAGEAQVVGTAAGHPTAPVVGADTAAAPGDGGSVSGGGGSSGLTVGAADVGGGEGGVGGTTGSDEGTAAGDTIIKSSRKKREKKEKPPLKPKRLTKKDIASQVEADARQGVFTGRSSLAESYSHIGMFTGRTVSGAWEALLAAGKERRRELPVGERQQQQQRGELAALDQLLAPEVPLLLPQAQQQQQQQEQQGGMGIGNGMQGNKQQQQQLDKEQQQGKKGLGRSAKGVEKIATKQVQAEDGHDCSDADYALLHLQYHGRPAAAADDAAAAAAGGGGDEVRRLALAGSGLTAAAGAARDEGLRVVAGGAAAAGGGGGSSRDVLQPLDPEKLRSPVAKAQLAVQGLVQAQQLEQLQLLTPLTIQQQQQQEAEHRSGPAADSPGAAAAAAAGGGGGGGGDLESQQGKLRELKRQASRGPMPQHLMLLQHSSQGALAAESPEAPGGVTRVTTSDDKSSEEDAKAAVAAAGNVGDTDGEKVPVVTSSAPVAPAQGKITGAVVSPGELRVLPNLGYACLNMTMREYDIFNSRDCVKKTFTASNGLEVTSQLALANARDLVPLIR